MNLKKINRFRILISILPFIILITYLILINVDNRYIRYIKSLPFIDKPSINIHINFDDQKKISTLLKKFEQKEIIIPNIKEYNFDAKIEFKNEMLETNFRLKGDTDSHYDDWNKLSLKFDLKDEYKFFGMEKFSIQDPWERTFLNEWVFYELCKELNLISPRYFFLNVFINGENKGIFNLEENFSKEMIEHNRRRESVIFKFSEERDILSKILYDAHFDNVDSEKILEIYEKKSILKNESLKKDFEYANNNLNAYFENQLKLEDVFDVDQWSKFFAIIDLTSGYHALKYGNLRLYFNPMSMLIEPIAYDAEINEDLLSGRTYLNNLDYDYWQVPFFVRDMLQNDKFYTKYITELRSLVEEDFLLDFFKTKEKFITSQINILNSDFNYSFYNNEFIGKFLERNKAIRNILNNDNNIYSYLSEGKLFIKNNSNHHLLINKINNKKISNNLLIIYKNELMQILKPNLQNYENLSIDYAILGDSKKIKEEIFLSTKSIDKKFNFYNQITLTDKLSDTYLINNLKTLTKNIIVKEGNNLVIEKGSRIILSEGNNFYVFGDLNIKGTKEQPVIIECEKNCWFYSNYANLNMKNVEFINFSEPIGFAQSMTGAITINRSNVKMQNVKIESISSEDSINIFDSNFVIDNLQIHEALSDGLDIDFSTGTIKNLIINNSGNDGVDFSNSTVEVENVFIDNAQDKCVSIGEHSIIKFKNLNLDSCYIALAVKDSSMVQLQGNIFLKNNDYDIASYIKKNIFNSPEINMDSFTELDLKIISEEGSNIIINGNKFKNNSLNTFDVLYKNEI